MLLWSMSATSHSLNNNMYKDFELIFNLHEVSCNISSAYHNNLDAG